MHEQIRTSPGSTEDNLKHVLDALVEIDIAGIGPDFEPPHIRVAVEHEPDDEGPVEAAMEALEAAHLHPVLCPAVTVWVPNVAGALRAKMRHLVREGYDIESVLVLASPPDQDHPEHVKVSFGVRERIEADWQSTSVALAEMLEAD